MPACPNCGAARDQDYCPSCGQPARDPRRDVSSLVAEVFGSFFSVDGRVWRSVVPLFFRPGFLTRAWIDGKRAAYMPPPRIFLFFTILLFLCVQMGTSTTDILLGKQDGGTVVTIDGKLPGELDDEEMGRQFELPLPGFWPFTLIEARLKAQQEKFRQLNQSEQVYLLTERGLQLAPIGVLLLLPLMALFLKLWWLGTGALYVDHLVFLMHSYAFVCGLITATMLLPLPGWSNAGAFLVILALQLLYFHRGMRRVYQRGFWRTLAGTLLGGFTTTFGAVAVVAVLLAYGLLTV